MLQIRVIAAVALYRHVAVPKVLGGAAVPTDAKLGLPWSVAAKLQGNRRIRHPC